MAETHEAVDSIQDRKLARVEARQDATDRTLERLVASVDRLDARLDSLRTPGSTIAAWAGLVLIALMSATGYVINHTSDGHPERVEQIVSEVRNENERARADYEALRAIVMELLQESR